MALCFLTGAFCTIPRMADLDLIVKQLEAERDRIDSAIRATPGYWADFIRKSAQYRSIIFSGYRVG